MVLGVGGNVRSGRRQDPGRPRRRHGDLVAIRIRGSLDGQIRAHRECSDRRVLIRGLRIPHQRGSHTAGLGYLGMPSPSAATPPRHGSTTLRSARMASSRGCRGRWHMPESCRPLLETALATLQGHESIVWSAAFSPDGATTLTSSEDGTARLWTVPTGLVVESDVATANVATFDPTGGQVITVADEQGHSPRHDHGRRHLHHHRIQAIRSTRTTTSYGPPSIRQATGSSPPRRRR